MTTAAGRFHVLYELNRRLAVFTDLEELLRFATRRTREVFGADGCALLLLDESRREFRFPVASQSEGSRHAEPRLAEIRFPADRGIAGWVLAEGKPVMVEDASRDPRFYRGVDASTGMTTRAVLCAPLRTSWGAIGVIEVVNPAPEALTADDLELLEALAGDIAVAHEKVLLGERLRREAVGLRQVCGIVGGGLVLAGLVSSVVAVVGHLAWALPVRELPARPGMVGGLAGVLVGLVLLAVARGGLVRRAPAPRL
jgi:sigma-B regulation protein RsbU (phosphoserine phosphatase)